MYKSISLNKILIISYTQLQLCHRGRGIFCQLFIMKRPPVVDFGWFVKPPRQALPFAPSIVFGQKGYFVVCS